MSIKTKEADIVINGIPLSQAQSMALMAAVAHMLVDMQDPRALGDDEHGLFMVKAYRARLSEIKNLVFRNLT